MNNPENKREPNDGNGKKRRRFLRSERGWRLLLRRADRSAARFANFYEHFVRDTEGLSCGTDCLDRCARAMGWQLSSDEDDDENDENFGNSPLSADAAASPLGNADESSEKPDDVPAAEQNSDALPAYALQNLPVSVAATGIYNFSREYWSRIWESPFAEKLTPKAASAVLEPLADAHLELLLGIDAREASEFGLAVGLLKRSLAAINRYFDALAKVLPPANPAKTGEEYADSREALRCAAMDLRELCLRILRETREEAAESSARGNA